MLKKLELKLASSILRRKVRLRLWLRLRLFVRRQQQTYGFFHLT